MLQNHQITQTCRQTNTQHPQSKNRSDWWNSIELFLMELQSVLCSLNQLIKKNRNSSPNVLFMFFLKFEFEFELKMKIDENPFFWVDIFFRSKNSFTSVTLTLAPVACLLTLASHRTENILPNKQTISLSLNTSKTNTQRHQLFLMTKTENRF